MMEGQTTLLCGKAYELIHTLWNKRGNTAEEEARICLSLLMRLGVCMYGKEYDQKRMRVEKRMEGILEALGDDSEMKDELKTFSLNEVITVSLLTLFKVGFLFKGLLCKT